MYSNLFVSERTALSTVKLQSYALSNEVDPREFYTFVKGLENRLLNRGFCAAGHGQKVFFAQNTGKPFKEERVGNAIFTLNDHVSPIEPTDLSLAEKLVHNALKLRARAVGYIGPEGGKFYRKTPYKSTFWRYHDAFESAVDMFPDGRVGIWLDPTTRWTQQVSDYVKWARQSLQSDETIQEYLLGRTVYCPSPTKSKNFKAQIVDASFDTIDNHRIEIQGRTYTIYEYWTKASHDHVRWLSHNSRILDPRETPVVTVQIPQTNIRPTYPPSVLQIRIDLDDPEIPPEALAEKKILPPEARINATLRLYDELLGEGLRIGGQTLIAFDRRLFEWTDSTARGYARTVSLEPPTLKFGGGAICESASGWADPDIKGALQKYGPVDPTEETIIHYIVPSEFANLVTILHSQLATLATILKLGKYRVGAVESVERSHPDRYSRVCRNLGRVVDGVVVVVLPKESVSRAYYAAKAGLGEFDTRSQMMHWQTASLLATERANWGRGVDSMGFNIVAQIYDKSLANGKSIWHLAKPAGGLDPAKTVYFMGFDVSRSPERGKEAAAYAAVCDSFGRILYRKSIDTHKGERIQAKVLSDWFFDVASHSFDEVSTNKPVDELILFKDGSVPQNQMIDYKSGSEDAKQRLVREGIMNEGGNIRILSVVKRGPHRIYGEKSHGYKAWNAAILFDTGQALVVTASAGRGTPSPLRIRFEHQLNKDMSIEQAIRIFNELRYLDYTSLYKQPKTILPLHIVQNLAKLSKEDINVPYVPR